MSVARPGLVATVVLAVFSIGYVAMAKHITAAAAFYGYIDGRHRGTRRVHPSQRRVRRCGDE